MHRTERQVKRRGAKSVGSPPGHCHCHCHCHCRDHRRLPTVRRRRTRSNPGRIAFHVAPRKPCTGMFVVRHFVRTRHTSLPNAHLKIAAASTPSPTSPSESPLKMPAALPMARRASYSLRRPCAMNKRSLHNVGCDGKMANLITSSDSV